MSTESWELHSHLYYVELKWILGPQLNHSFANLKAIVAWDTSVKHGGTVTDINGEIRTLHITPADKSDPTRYFLDNPKRSSKIEVFVLKHYLHERYKIEFRPRTSADVV
ncbi:MAG TPA: hypothetical protein VGR71_14825 [Nitrospira sp.]|nr:hypothetical protein [Nitrospira sp.]